MIYNKSHCKILRCLIVKYKTPTLIYVLLTNNYELCLQG